MIVLYILAALYVLVGLAIFIKSKASLDYLFAFALGWPIILEFEAFLKNEVQNQLELNKARKRADPNYPVDDDGRAL